MQQTVEQRQGRESAGPSEAARAGRAWRRWLLFSNDGGITEEQGQALARIALAAFGCVLFLGMQYAGHDHVPLLLTLVYLLGSLLYLSFVTRHKTGYPWRRYLVILLDLAVATFLTAYFSGAGVAFYPLFLWVMIGNGVRYGQHFM